VEEKQMKAINNRLEGGDEESEIWAWSGGERRLERYWEAENEALAGGGDAVAADTYPFAWKR
jgi:hypothetical protein